VCAIGHAPPEAPSRLLVPLQFTEWLTIPDSAFEWLDHMTFIIEATRDDQRTADIRSSVIDAVILARKLAADGFAVTISTPAGRQYGADQFKLLLTSESVNSQGVGEGG
jgi:hypothetical protein